jgi:hypothetical protein
MRIKVLFAPESSESAATACRAHRLPRPFDRTRDGSLDVRRITTIRHASQRLVSIWIGQVAAVVAIA